MKRLCSVCSLLVIATLVSACASDRAALAAIEPLEKTLAAEAATASEEFEGPDVICRREIVTGTHRRVRVCTTREQRRRSREAAQEVLRDVVRPQAFIGSEGGQED